MLKVLLVDDEPFITMGLKALIDWEDYGFEVVYIADDGEEALTYLKEHTVDLLITDILMPKRSGLSLIEEAKQLHPSMKFIVLSGYKEFDYIKQGMALGIENYLVKPVDEEELIRTIQAVRKKLAVTHEEVHDTDYMTLKDNTLWRLLNGDIETNEWQERLAFYEMNVQRAFYCVSILEFERSTSIDIGKKLREHIEQHYPATCLYSPDQDIIIIFDGDEEEELFEHNKALCASLKDNEEIGRFYISMGSPVESMSKLEESYDEAREFSYYQVTIEPDSLISPQSNIDRQELIDMQQNYQEGLVKRLLRSEEEALMGIELVYQVLTQQQFISPDVFRKYMIDLISYVNHSIRDVKYNQHTAAIERLVFSHDIEKMKEILREYCFELINAIDEHQENRSPVVQKVLEYMHAHFDEELSLKTLGHRFHVNPIYLGQLFQKEIGVVFSEYINHYRLERAKEMLKTTHLRAGEIGKKVGYTDTAYFYRQFKKYVGVTPTEWRNL